MNNMILVYGTNEFCKSSLAANAVLLDMRKTKQYTVNNLENFMVNGRSTRVIKFSAME